MAHWPLASAVPVPMTVLPLYSVTVLPASAVPLKVGVGSLVLPPLATMPAAGDTLSVALVMVGALGAVVSTVKLKLLLAAPVLPAASVAVAVMVWLPAARALVVMVQLPLSSAVTLPTTVVPSYSVTVLPASAVPRKVGVVSLVLPLWAKASVTGATSSLALTMSGMSGAVVSTVALPLPWALVLPAVSTMCAVTAKVLPSAGLAKLVVT